VEIFLMNDRRECIIHQEELEIREVQRVWKQKSKMLADQFPQV
jgi:hypothetical protein